jgi:hypothetical protein
MLFFLCIILLISVGGHASNSTRNTLFVSSYGGQVYSLALTEDNDQAALEVVDSNTGCAPSPAWLAFDQTDRVIYCFDEGIH